jgi:hypothetical protein
MAAEKHQRKPYTAPTIHMAAQPVLNVYAAASQLSTSQAAATFLLSTSQTAAQASQWSSSTQWANIFQFFNP